MKHCVMTIDDSTSIREMASLTLKSAGYEVLQAQDGLEAIRKLACSSVDLIITDVNMPNMGGLELTASVRENPALKFLPILFLTTESQEVKMEEAMNLGATGWIVKPFHPDQLIRIVKKILG